MFISHKPFLVIISSPSGAGKSTLCKMIAQNDPLTKLSISATTRPKRPQEVDGLHYFFINQKKFDEMVAKNQFVEHAFIFGNNYGTPKKMVEDALKNGSEVLFDIDWQGSRQIKEKFDKDSVISIFILPPSLAELERRLRNRAQDSQEIVQSRMNKARDEISHFDEYDYILVNDDLDSTYKKIRAIIDAKRVARFSLNQIGDLVKQFN
ncbi:MAG TPA: guanylate kinase [Rickettsiales bacterium]|nr:guanylate kinase [Rickettsiales bacterium]